MSTIRFISLRPRRLNRMISSSLFKKSPRGRPDRGPALAEHGPTVVQFEEKSRAYMEELKDKFPKAKPISFKATADSGVLKDAPLGY
jgi:hypothetical protein